MRRIRDAAPVAFLTSAMARLMRLQGTPTSGRDQPVVSDEPETGTTPPCGPKGWMIHPDIEAIMRELGIDTFVLPDRDDAPVLRERAPGGGYWRIEYVPRPGGRLDHSIRRRGGGPSPVESVTTMDGAMEVVLDLGELPDTVITALPGRRLGDMIDIAAPAGDAILDGACRRIMAASRPTVLRTAPCDYVMKRKRP